MLPISVVILTYNSEATINATLESVRAISDDVHVVDSYSSDNTLDLIRAHGSQVVQHAFENYGAQRNWAIDTLPFKYDWQLHLDADERLSDDLVRELNRLFEAGPPDDIAGYYVPRLLHFLQRPLKHGGLFPTYHMRLFRRAAGRCESRRYDQHFYVKGKSANLASYMIDDVHLSLSEWTNRHNRWSDAEVEELLHPTEHGVVAPGRETPVAVKRAQRRLYDSQPLFLRPFLLFFYRYVWKRGFLDGTEGFIFYVLQTFWFRFLVDAKVYERRRPKNAAP
jgi:glycosyltransferase involved in cell wall biosynthesis